MRKSEAKDIEARSSVALAATEPITGDLSQIDAGQAEFGQVEAGQGAAAQFEVGQFGLGQAPS